MSQKRSLLQSEAAPLAPLLGSTPSRAAAGSASSGASTAAHRHSVPAFRTASPSRLRSSAGAAACPVA